MKQIEAGEISYEDPRESFQKKKAAEEAAAGGGKKGGRRGNRGDKKKDAPVQANRASMSRAEKDMAV